MTKTRKRPLGKREASILAYLRDHATCGGSDHPTNRAIRSLEDRGLVEVTSCHVETGYVGHRITERNRKSYVVLSCRLTDEGRKAIR